MRKLTKKTLVLLTATIMLAMLTGCEMIGIYDIVINKNGTSTVYSDVIMDEELAQMFSDDGTTDDLEEVERGKKTYYSSGEGETEKFKTIDDLIEYLEDENGWEDVKITTRSFEATINTKDQTNELLDGEYTSSDLSDNDIDVSIEFSVTFPYKVTDTNGDLSDDEKTVTWKVESDDDEITMKAECKSPILSYILIAVGVIALTAIITAIGIVVLKNVKKSDDGDNDDFTSTNNIPEATSSNNDYSRFAPSSNNVNTSEPEATATETSINDYSRFAPSSVGITNSEVEDTSSNNPADT